MSRDGKYVAAYDVSDDRERTRVSKVLEGYGLRVQRSVFEIRLTVSSRERIKRSLEELGLQTGCVLIYRVNDHAKRISVGECVGMDEEEDYAFVV